MLSERAADWHSQQQCERAVACGRAAHDGAHRRRAEVFFRARRRSESQSAPLRAPAQPLGQRRVRRRRIVADATRALVIGRADELRGARVPDRGSPPRCLRRATVRRARPGKDACRSDARLFEPVSEAGAEVVRHGRQRLEGFGEAARGR